MSWLWKRKLYRPFGPDFIIYSALLDDPPSNDHAEYILPYNYYAQLICVTLSCSLGILASTHTVNVEAFRAQTRLYTCPSISPDSVVGWQSLTFGVGHILSNLRNSAFWGSAPILDHFYLYPQDRIVIIAYTSGAANYSMRNIILTFKAWQVV